MKHCEVSQLFFRETYTVPPEQTARRLFRLLSHAKAYAERKVDAMATGYLVSVLESICAREMQPHLDQDEETIIGSSVDCRHHAPISPGALVTVNGWVVGLGDREATFWVQASDEHEVVCEGQIRLLIVLRSQIQKKIQRECDAIGRRELFAGRPLGLVRFEAAPELISKPVGNPWGARPEASSRAGTSRSQPGEDHENSFDNI